MAGRTKPAPRRSRFTKQPMLQIDSTLKHPLDQVCDLVRFAYRVVECYYARAKAEDRLKTPITVEIQNSSRSAYSGSAGRGRGRVFMRIAGASFYPTLAKYRRYTHIPEFPCYLLESWQEGLVMLAAHESLSHGRGERPDGRGILM